MKAFKGFTPQPDGTLKCRDKIYIPGETYTELSAVPCRSGMHACLVPFDIFDYYGPAGSVWRPTSSEVSHPPSAARTPVGTKF